MCVTTKGIQQPTADQSALKQIMASYCDLWACASSLSGMFLPASIHAKMDCSELSCSFFAEINATQFRCSPQPKQDSARQTYSHIVITYSHIVWQQQQPLILYVAILEGFDKCPQRTETEWPGWPARISVIRPQEILYEPIFIEYAMIYWAPYPKDMASKISHWRPSSIHLHLSKDVYRIRQE